MSKDFVENESGLEYIGESNQRMGDGGVIMQVSDSTGTVIAATQSDWKGLSIFRAPLNPERESSASPLDACETEVTPEPADQVDAKEGYYRVDWDPSAHIIWASDLLVDNTILWRFTLTK